MLSTCSGYCQAGIVQNISDVDAKDRDKWIELQWTILKHHDAEKAQFMSHKAFIYAMNRDEREGS